MAREENEFLRTRGFAEYAALCLGINEEQPGDTKGRHEFPSDFENVQRTLRREPRWPILALWRRKRGSALTRDDRWPPTAIKAASACSSQNRARAAT